MLYLASQSPRRRQLLEQIGVAFVPIDVDVPEIRRSGESAEDYVRRVAHDKAGAGLARLDGRADVVVLGADVEVVLDDDVFGKPADLDDAARMLRRLSGRTHRVISAVWCLSPLREACAVNVTEVCFAELNEAQIGAYLATGEAMGKAGAYGIQGKAAAFVSRIAGSYTGVMGLPLFETAALLRGFGIVV